MPNHKKFKKPPLTKKQRANLAKAMKGNQNAVGADSGRPTDYSPKVAKRIYRMLLLMMPIKEICAIQEIAESTFFRWQKEIPEFKELVYKGQYGIDEDIIVTLKKKATGYTRKAIKPFKMKDDKTGSDVIVNHEYTEYHPPDTRAIELCLRNRTNTKTGWSSLPDVDLPPPPAPTINVNQIDLSKLDDATIKKLLSAIKPPDTKS
jgi:hypothetical protein